MSDNKEMRWTLAAFMAAMNGDIENAIIAATPGGIEAQERAGQGSFVASETLPKKSNGDMDAVHIYAALGIDVLGEADDLFFRVKLPEGWRKVADDHAMWSRLVDDKGRVRASIFYKAAFYDRSAHISFKCRYRYGDRPVGGWDATADTETWEGFVSDCGQDIFVTTSTDTVSRENRHKTDLYEQRQAKRIEAEAWIMARFPNYGNPLAYWGE